MLALSVCGCGTIFPPEMYVPPDLPKSELAAIKFDTKSPYIKGMNLIEVRINGKRALRQKIEDDKNISIHDVFVAPGKQDMSVTIRHHVWYSWGSSSYNLQTTSTFSVELKSGGTYLVRVARYLDGGPFIELIDKNTGEVVNNDRKHRYRAAKRYNRGF
ncbi:hypothetical protein C6501_19490 [Candidatus Poribacteria bacterium]|nr:MAG: hypothetical protein C6501_19490 [Candidatus Poribacteria bacterium]